jgi:hypothetical protein
MGTVTRSTETLTEAMPGGSSQVSISLGSTCSRRLRYSAPTACPTRSMLLREYGSRMSSRPVASASRDVTCDTR